MRCEVKSSVLLVRSARRRDEYSVSSAWRAAGTLGRFAIQVNILAGRLRLRKKFKTSLRQGLGAGIEVIGRPWESYISRTVQLGQPPITNARSAFWFSSPLHNEQRTSPPRLFSLHDAYVYHYSMREKWKKKRSRRLRRKRRKMRARSSTSLRPLIARPPS